MASTKSMVPKVGGVSPQEGQQYLQVGATKGNKFPFQMFFCINLSQDKDIASICYFIPLNEMSRLVGIRVFNFRCSLRGS